VHAVNVGTAAWLQSAESRGSVWLGAHLYDRNGGLTAFDFARYPLPFQDSLAPGASIDFEIDVEVPAHPSVVCFDLVSEGVAWFELSNSQTVRIEL
jgi:hypothetical protein